MQRKPTPQSRGPNAAERAHIKWIKERGICAACGNDGGVIAHHCEGSTFRNNKVLCGHFFVIGLCQCCDNIITRGSRKAFREAFGAQSELWLKQAEKYPVEIPLEIIQAIASYGK